MSKTTEWKFDLGVTLQDLVTGFKGIATSRLEYINGCKQYGIRAKVDDKNAMPDSQYIDQQQLKQVDKGISVEIADVGCENHPDRPRA